VKQSSAIFSNEGRIIYVFC